MCASMWVKVHLMLKGEKITCKFVCVFVCASALCSDNVFVCECACVCMCVFRQTS